MSAGRRHCLSRAPEHYVHQPVLVWILALPFVPSGVASKLSEQIGGENRGGVDWGSMVAIGGHIKRIGLAVEFAHEAGLAVRLPGNDGAAVRAGVEDVCRAYRNARIAGSAAVGDDEFDHWASSIRVEE
jgi:hypothetical protein